jgi:inosine-uridine nucleoside N-ribohydrolase
VTPIWLDCDPGHDDVVAILTASQQAQLIGISTVAGNAPLDRTTHNALVVTELCDIDVRVHAGCARPLLVEPVWAANIHGSSGLAGPTMPPLSRQAASGHGALAMLDASHAVDGMWIVATGPLTNVALALRLDPSLTDRIAGIAVMGGGVAFGNTTPAAEFNIWADPEAASIVVTAGSDTDLRIVTLDVTHEVLMTAQDVASVRGVGGHRAEFFADVVRHFAEAYRDVFFDDAVGPLHDPCAVLAVTHPELIELRPRHVTVERTGERTRGMLVVDQRGVKGAAPANARVSGSIDADAVHSMLLDVIRRASE